MGLGLQGGYGAAGGYDALAQLLQQQAEQELRAEQHRQALEAEAMRRQQLQQSAMGQQQEQERWSTDRADQQAAAAAKASAATADETAFDTELGNVPDPAMRGMLKLQRRGATGVNVHTMHTPEQEQQEAAAKTAADLNTKRREAEITASTTAKYRAPTAPVKDTYGEWQRKYDYELTHPKASTAAGGPAGLQRARAQSAVQMLDRLQEVHAKLQTGEGPGQIVRGISVATGGRVNLNNAATEYQKLRRATAVALAVAIQGSRPSDADAEAMASLLPDFTTPAAVAKNLFAASKAQLQDTAENMGGSPSGTAGGPQVGDMKQFPNGKKGRWDGKGWVAVP